MKDALRIALAMLLTLLAALVISSGVGALLIGTGANPEFGRACGVFAGLHVVWHGLDGMINYVKENT